MNWKLDFRSRRSVSTLLTSELRRKPFTTDEAKQSGLSHRMLSYYVEKGELERLARGVYRFTDYIGKDENLMWRSLLWPLSEFQGE